MLKKLPPYDVLCHQRGIDRGGSGGRLRTLTFIMVSDIYDKKGYVYVDTI